MVLQNGMELLQLWQGWRQGFRGCPHWAIAYRLLIRAVKILVGGATDMNVVFASPLAQDRQRGSLFGRPECLDHQERELLIVTAQGLRSIEIDTLLSLHPTLNPPLPCPCGSDPVTTAIGATDINGRTGQHRSRSPHPCSEAQVL